MTLSGNPTGTAPDGREQIARTATRLEHGTEATVDNTGRIYYIDNLRIVLSSLVVLFHLSITYGAVGSWAYIETEAEFPSSYFLTLFTATCQSFFMGMFFFISAYFTYGAVTRKGTRPFLADRLVRLGIPLLIYIFLLEPLTVYFAQSWQPDHISLIDIFREGYGRSVGAMWFVAALCCFTLLYTLARQAFPGLRETREAKSFLLRSVHIGVFILALSLVTFLVRMEFPVGRTLPYLGFNVAHFSQYIALFVLGILAAQYGVGEPIPLAQAKHWLLFASGMVAFGFPVLFLAGGAASGEVAPFLGGMHWQSFAYAFWEQSTGIALISGLLGLTRVKWNRTGRIAKELAGSAYALYVFHAPVIVAVSVLFRNWALPPLAKFVVLSPVALGASFLVAFLIRRLPYARRVF